MGKKYRITSRCDNERCQTDTFVTERKTMEYKSTAGTIEMCTRQVCPGCKSWGHIGRAFTGAAVSPPVE